MKRLILFTIFYLVSVSAHASEITGMFSSFKVGVSGDLIGIEIHIVPDPTGYSAIVQGSEGAPGFPEVLKITRKANKIMFTVPNNSGSGLAPGKWEGKVLNKELRLTGPYHIYVLPRKHSFWQ